MADEQIIKAEGAGGAEKKTAEKPEEAAKAKAAKPRKKKVARHVPIGRAYVQATYNNTIVTLTDQNGNVLSWSSSGSCGFKGPKKLLPTPPALLSKMRQIKFRSAVCRKSTFLLRESGQDVKQRFEL